MRILYQHSLCPYARQVRLVLGEKQLDFALEAERHVTDVIDTWPILKDLNGAFVSHPYAMVEYLEERYPERPLWSNECVDRTDVRRFMGWASDVLGRGVSEVLLFEKYGKCVEKKGVPDSGQIRQAKHQLSICINALESMIDRRHCLAGEQVTHADLAVAAHFSVIDYLGDVDWERYTTLKGWYMRLKSRPSFRPILADRISGFAPSPHYDDLDF